MPLKRGAGCRSEVESFRDREPVLVSLFQWRSWRWFVAKDKHKDKGKGKKSNKKEKEKDKKKGKTKASAAPAPEPVHQTFTPGQSYADGTPMDAVTYLEAKLILKPDRFTSVQAFRDFGKLVDKTAKKVGVGFITDVEAGLRPQVREITF